MSLLLVAGAGLEPATFGSMSPTSYELLDRVFIMVAAEGIEPPTLRV